MYLVYLVYLVYAMVLHTHTQEVHRNKDEEMTYQTEPNENETMRPHNNKNK